MALLVDFGFFPSFEAPVNTRSLSFESYECKLLKPFTVFILRWGVQITPRNCAANPHSSLMK